MKKQSEFPNEQEPNELTDEQLLNVISDEQWHIICASIPDAIIINELIRRGLITPSEGQISLMTKEFPLESDNEENEGEEWKKSK